MITLDEILEAKRRALEARKRNTPIEAVRALASMQARPLSLLNSVTASGSPLLIGRIAYTPPADDAVDGDDLIGSAVGYARAGLDAVSLFTDETVYDGGQDDLMFLVRAMQPLRIPVITEDYVLDEYQIVEARAAGASAIMLDTDCIDMTAVRALASLTERNRMTAIIRVSRESTLDAAIALSPQAIALRPGDLPGGANLDDAQRLRPRIPNHIRVVLDGGLMNVSDARAAALLGVHALILDGPLLEPRLITRIRAELSANKP